MTRGHVLANTHPLIPSKRLEGWVQAPLPPAGAASTSRLLYTNLSEDITDPEPNIQTILPGGTSSSNGSSNSRNSESGLSNGTVAGITSNSGGSSFGAIIGGVAGGIAAVGTLPTGRICHPLHPSLQHTVWPRGSVLPVPGTHHSAPSCAPVLAVVAWWWWRRKSSMYQPGCGKKGGHSKHVVAHTDPKPGKETVQTHAHYAMPVLWTHCSAVGWDETEFGKACLAKNSADDCKKLR